MKFVFYFIRVYNEENLDFKVLELLTMEAFKVRLDVSGTFIITWS